MTSERGTVLENLSEMRRCAECGSLIEPGAEFCYSCGANVRPAPGSNPEPSGAAQPEEVRYDPETIHRNIVTSLKIASVAISKLILIWVLLSLIMGIVSIAISPLMKETLEDVYHVTFSYNQMLLEGICLIISGLAALVASVLLRKLRFFWLCLASCIASALISYPGMGGFVGVITAAIGLYMSMAIYRCRPAFEEPA